MLPKPVRRLWNLLGVASDLQGRVPIVALAVGGVGVVTGTTVGQSALIAVGLLAIGLAIALLVSGHWHQEQRMKEADQVRAAAWRPPVEPRALGRYLEEINETMEAHGFGRNPMAPLNVLTPDGRSVWQWRRLPRSVVLHSP